MTKQNENCLEGMHCPKCKALEPFRIEILTYIEVFDDGTGDTESSTEWEDDSYCQCVSCEYEAKVKDFQIEEIAK